MKERKKKVQKTYFLIDSNKGFWLFCPIISKYFWKIKFWTRKRTQTLLEALKKNKFLALKVFLFLLFLNAIFYFVLLLFISIKKKKKDIMNVLPLPERTGPEREWKRETGGTTLHTEYKLVFSRALTRIQCLVVWSNTSQDMAVKIFLQRWLTFKSIDFEKSRFLFTTWMGLIQSVEGLKNKDGFPEEKAILSPYCKAESSSADFRFKTAASTSFLNLWLPYRFQACEPLQPRELFP